MIETPSPVPQDNTDPVDLAKQTVAAAKSGMMLIMYSEVLCVQFQVCDLLSSKEEKLPNDYAAQKNLKTSAAFEILISCSYFRFFGKLTMLGLAKRQILHFKNHCRRV